MMTDDPRNLVFMRLSLRFLQFVASLVIVVTLSYAFSSANTSEQHDAAGRNDVTYAALMGFLGLVYALFYLVFVEILMLCMRPLLYCELAMDFAIALLLLIASVVLTVSRVVQQCRAHHDNKPHCDAVFTGVVFCYISMVAFVASLVLNCCTSCDANNSGYDRVFFGEDSPISIEYDPTPVAAESESIEYDPTPVAAALVVKV